MLQRLARLTRNEGDVIGFLHDVAERERQAATVGKVKVGVRALARIASYAEIEPTVFGSGWT